MSLRYTHHAEERMREREITKDDVEDAVNRPYGAPEPGSRPDTIVVRGALVHPDGTRLKVILDAAVGDRVVSAMWEDVTP
jgi:hypothetical protein